MTVPLLVVKDLKKHYPLAGGKALRALDGVSFELDAGETLGVVGESGCGKSTLGRSILRLVPATSGQVDFKGKDIYALNQRQLRHLRKDMQIVFQDPYSSLNPRMTVGDIITEALEAKGPIQKQARRAAIIKLLETVGLSHNSIDRYPHEFSGGQRQRIGIARALAVEPTLIVCDEPVSALDVSVQSHILNLLCDLKAELGLTYLFIAHDLAVVSHISDRVAVMYLGRIVEIGPTETIYNRPAHPYTKALLSAIPVPIPGHVSTQSILAGELPSPVSPPEGCHFHTRCPIANSYCREVQPPYEEASAGHMVACHYADVEVEAAAWLRTHSAN